MIQSVTIENWRSITRPRPEVKKIITQPRKLVVRSIMNPEPDLRKLAKEFVKVTEHLALDDE
jgi:hypothetical protein